MSRKSLLGMMAILGAVGTFEPMQRESKRYLYGEEKTHSEGTVRVSLKQDYAGKKKKKPFGVAKLSKKQRRQVK